MRSERIEGHAWEAYVALETFLSDGTRDGLRTERSKVTESWESSWESRPTRADGRAVYRAKHDRWSDRQQPRGRRNAKRQTGADGHSRLKGRGGDHWRAA
jgi:hypothetical protein